MRIKGSEILYINQNHKTSLRSITNLIKVKISDLTRMTNETKCSYLNFLQEVLQEINCHLHNLQFTYCHELPIVKVSFVFLYECIFAYSEFMLKNF